MVLFPPPFYFFFISQTSYRTYTIISSYELARPIMGTIFLVKYDSCIFMVQVSLESKIQHKHQQCDEILSTFTTRVNKLRIKQNSTQTSTMEMLSTFMKIIRVNSGAPDIHFFPVLHSTSLVCKRRCSVQRGERFWSAQCRVSL